MRWKDAIAKRPTLIPLLLDLKLLCEILLFFPFNICPDGFFIDEFAQISNFILINVGLFKYLVLEKVIFRETEQDLEPKLRFIIVGEVFQSDVCEMFQCSRIAIRDELREANMVPKRCQPEFRDSLGFGVFDERSVVFVIFDGLFFTSFDLFWCRRRWSMNDSVPALV